MGVNVEDGVRAKAWNHDRANAIPCIVRKREKKDHEIGTSKS
jgi:hypothetical protein